jgi:hypothetical protein
MDLCEINNEEFYEKFLHHFSFNQNCAQLIRNTSYEGLFSFVLAFAVFMGLPSSHAVNKRKSSVHLYSTEKIFVFLLLV